jgi:hypothetical protein
VCGPADGTRRRAGSSPPGFYGSRVRLSLTFVNQRRVGPPIGKGSGAGGTVNPWSPFEATGLRPQHRYKLDHHNSGTLVGLNQARRKRCLLQKHGVHERLWARARRDRAVRCCERCERCERRGVARGGRCAEEIFATTSEALRAVFTSSHSPSLISFPPPCPSAYACVRARLTHETALSV